MCLRLCILGRSCIGKYRTYGSGWGVLGVWQSYRGNTIDMTIESRYTRANWLRPAVPTCG